MNNEDYIINAFKKEIEKTENILLMKIAMHFGNIISYLMKDKEIMETKFLYKIYSTYCDEAVKRKLIDHKYNIELDY